MNDAFCELPRLPVAISTQSTLTFHLFTLGFCAPLPSLLNHDKQQSLWDWLLVLTDPNLLLLSNFVIPQFDHWICFRTG